MYFAGRNTVFWKSVFQQFAGKVIFNRLLKNAHMQGAPACAEASAGRRDPP